MNLSPAPLHIPDGFLNLGTSLVMWFIVLIVLAIAVRRTRDQIGDRQIPMMGIIAAFIFAAQMINFPVTGGTSGHLLGGALAAIFLGPWAGILVMTSVIAVQALLFQDGGLLVMGANILNMGILTATVGYGIYRLFANQPRRVLVIVSGIAAWISVMVGAFATSIQLWLSATSRLGVVLPAMMGVHVLIGLGEALITAAAVGFIMQVRPQILQEDEIRSRGNWVWVVFGVIITIVVVLAAPLASTNPDGLESVAAELGFVNQAAEPTYNIFPDYSLPILGETPISTILAGLIGVCLLAGIGLLVAKLMNRKAMHSEP